MSLFPKISSLLWDWPQTDLEGSSKPLYMAFQTLNGCLGIEREMGRFDPTENPYQLGWGWVESLNFLMRAASHYGKGAKKDRLPAYG